MVECKCASIDVPQATVPIKPSDFLMLLITYLTDVVTGKAKPDIPIFVYGPPGIGKTQIVNEAAAEVSKRTSRKVVVRTILASTMSSSDVSGVPSVTSIEAGGRKFDVTTWNIPEMFVPAPEPEYTVMFFDELNTAPMSVRAALYRLILEGRLGNVDISNTIRIGAGNNKDFVPELARMGGAWLGTPLATRFNIYWMVPDYASWMSWAQEHGINGAGIDFLTQNPQYVFCVDPRMECIGQFLATPRGWERVSDMIKYGMTRESDFQAALGSIVGSKFYTAYTEYVKNHEMQAESRPDSDFGAHCMDFKGSPEQFMKNLEATMPMYQEKAYAELLDGSETSNKLYYIKGDQIYPKDKDLIQKASNLVKCVYAMGPEIHKAYLSKPQAKAINALATFDPEASIDRDKMIYDDLKRKLPVGDIRRVAYFFSFMYGIPWDGVDAKKDPVIISGKPYGDYDELSKLV